ncbi:PEP-CTERM sorting domain-containing protein [Pseudoduganella sp. FT93W]|uniref:PEP-CTERM sorting domain-containing protein n=1 Tax=Duganella fentianensis TaxID=2692177 RepID=A0A845I5S2_9BURK|nr:FxDxF family PEP-CTERM protein [Duganella fentianensis]MYN46518.1 PEP-CTERM sorting domain-containing protein [Duganella fentianensis]
MKITSLLAAGLLAAACGQVSATDVSQNVGMIGGPVYFTGSFGASHIDGDEFTDTFTFTFSASSGLSTGSFKSLQMDGKQLTLSSVKLNSYDLTYSNGVYSSASYIDLPVNSPFTLTIKGTDPGIFSYSGTVYVTAVPEPATYGMMLGGMALLGVVARRRKG